MRRQLIAGLLLAGLGACRQSSQPLADPEPDYADWYALKAPEARPIEAVWGDLDGTLTIATRTKIYVTTDRGKTWQTSNYPGSPGLFGLTARRDTLFALTSGQATGAVDSTATYASTASHYSTDQGRTWRDYRYPAGTAFPFGIRVARNRVRTPGGNTYRIAINLVPAGNSSSAYVYTPGIQRDGGPVQPLPHDHQLNSLYLDPQARLYVAGSAPLCGGASFTYCGEPNGYLYVSKKPLP